ncbi:MAG: hypothetical protein V2A61_03820 [Calditrichota bacterium]
MNETLKKLIITYATADHEEFRRELGNLSRDTLASTLSDLLTIYFNDTNSSRMREMVTTILSGYEVLEGKLGYNGYRQAAPGGPREYCEVKPKNVRLSDDGKLIRGSLDGGGTYNDYTLDRLIKHKKEDPTLLISGFVDGQLLYILKAPFHCIYERLNDLIERKFPGGQRDKGDYLRGASFNFSHYQNCADTKIIRLSKNIELFRHCINRKFFEWLLTHQSTR